MQAQLLCCTAQEVDRHTVMGTAAGLLLLQEAAAAHVTYVWPGTTATASACLVVCVLSRSEGVCVPSVI